VLNSTQGIFRVTPGLLVLAACGNTDPKGSVGVGGTTSDGGAFPSTFMSGGQTASRSTSADGGSHFHRGGSSAIGGIGTTASQTEGVNQGGGITSTLNGTAGKGLAVGSSFVGGSNSGGQSASGGTSTSSGRQVYPIRTIGLAVSAPPTIQPRRSSYSTDSTSAPLIRLNSLRPAILPMDPSIGTTPKL
jgi:hypothetical protein